MLFSELYSAYYNAVAKILSKAVKGSLTEEELKRIIEEKAFGESATVIPASLKSERWQLLTSDLRTPIKTEPIMPLTTIQKRWLKAITLDPRVKLFGVEIKGLDGVKPLFTPEDICYYDKYLDGDDFTDDGYVQRFRMILDAIKNRRALKINFTDAEGCPIFARVMPEYLEYSEKDDKFRLISSGSEYVRSINLARITSCKISSGRKLNEKYTSKKEKETLTFILINNRNALERATLHFAHFEKTVEKIEEDKYLIKINYEIEDRSELLIRILSFGQFIRVQEPLSFINLIKERLKKQKYCGI